MECNGSTGVARALHEFRQRGGERDPGGGARYRCRSGEGPLGTGRTIRGNRK
ncbi:hypothetical protein D3C76_719300 [compost metagenome]